ncbi:MAG: MFS transporter, partial [Betaproteobacteria bacterium]
VLVGQRADRALHRAPFVIGALLLIAAGLVLLAAVGHTVLPSLLALTLTATGVLVFVSSFWSIPTAFLQQSAAAAGLAWINSIGNLGGQFGPDLIGRVREATGGSTGALLTLATLAVLGALVTARVAPRPSR